MLSNDDPLCVRQHAQVSLLDDAVSKIDRDKEKRNIKLQKSRIELRARVR